MDDSRSFESQEESDSPVETTEAARVLDAATYEPEMRVETAEGFEQAEAIETDFVQVVEVGASEEVLPTVGSVREASTAHDTSDSPFDRETSSGEDGVDDSERNRRQPEGSEDGERELQVVMVQAALSKKQSATSTLSKVVKKAEETKESVIRNL